MAIHPSALKRARQNLKRRERNRKVRSTLRTLEKSARASITERDGEKATELVKTVCRAYDKAVSKNVLHINCAARHKARIAKVYNTMMAEGPIEHDATKVGVSKRATRRAKKTTTKKSTEA